MIFRCKFGRKCRQHMTYYKDDRQMRMTKIKHKKGYDLAKEKIIPFNTIECVVIHVRAKSFNAACLYKWNKREVVN